MRGCTKLSHRLSWQGKEDDNAFTSNNNNNNNCGNYYHNNSRLVHITASIPAADAVDNDDDDDDDDDDNNNSNTNGVAWRAMGAGGGSGLTSRRNAETAKQEWGSFHAFLGTAERFGLVVDSRETADRTDSFPLILELSVSVCPCLSLSVSLCLYLSVYFCLSVSLSVCLSVSV